MRIFKYGAYLVVFLAVLCIYSWMVYHASTGGDKLGRLKKPLLKFASFPRSVTNVVNSPEVQNQPITYLPIDSSIAMINNLQEDLYGLTSFWDNRINQWEIRLFNFRNDSILHKWYFKKSTFKRHKVQYQNALPYNSILLRNKDLILYPVPTPNLMRLDSNSNVVWKIDSFLFHHSLNLGSDGNLWLCANHIFKDGNVFPGGGFVKNVSGELISYWENYIVKVDIETGETLLVKGVAKILLENGYKGIVYGKDLEDPIHLNDIQPVLEDGTYWKKDDLLLSLRNRSIVLLYRPSNNKIIRIIQGPFIGQHDVDILNDKQISIFNNNHIFSRGYDTQEANMEVDSLNSSEIVIYDFEKDSFSVFRKEMFLKENIITATQGLSEFLEVGTFVEEQNTGVYYIFDESGIVMKKAFFTPDSNYFFTPTWMRLYEKLPF